ncbi:hypothetical protein Tco_1252544 [Tanacetum coccineum]
MRQRRWMKLFSEYGFKAKYHLGKANVVVEPWSRRKSEAKNEFWIDVAWLGPTSVKIDGEWFILVRQGSDLHLEKCKDLGHGRARRRALFREASEARYGQGNVDVVFSCSFGIVVLLFATSVEYDRLVKVVGIPSVALEVYWEREDYMRQDLGFIPSDNVVLSSTYVGKILGADQLLVILCYRYQESGIGYWILSMTISGSGSELYGASGRAMWLDESWMLGVILLSV